MHVHSEGTVPRLDLDPVRRLVPALWAEWHALTFDDRGYVRDPADSTRSFAVLRLAQGRHRSQGARYKLAADGSVVATFVFAADDGGVLRGTVAGQLWRADIELGTHWHADGRVDVRALLERNEVPGWAIGLIGGRLATGQLRAEPSVLDHRGDVLSGQGQAQRAAGAVTVHVITHRDQWQGRISVRIHGRGLLGRLALVVGRSAVAKGIRQSMAEFWPDATRGLTSIRTELDGLDERYRAAGGPGPWLHEQLWRNVRQTPPPAPPTPVEAGHDPVAPGGPRKHGLARRYNCPEVIVPQKSTRLVIDRLRVTERPDRITAQVGQASRASSPPRFRGRLEQQGGRTVLVGAIRESATNAWMPKLYAMVTVIVVVIGVFGAVDTAQHGFGQGGVPLLIGSIGGVLFSLLTWLFAGTRRRDFVKQSADLADSLGAWLLERG